MDDWTRRVDHLHGRYRNPIGEDRQDLLNPQLCDLDHRLDSRVEDLSEIRQMSLEVCFLIDLVVDLSSLLNRVK